MKSDPSIDIPNTASTSEIWITWHKQLKKWFSKKEANAYFVKFWNQRAGASSSADTHTLRAYMSSQGVELTTDWSGTLSNASHSVVDWFVTGMNWTRGIVFGVTILAVGIGSFYLVTQIKKGKTVKDAAKLAANVETGGMLKAANATKLLK